MIAGIDIGTDFTQVAIVNDEEELVGIGESRTGFDLQKAVDEAIADALDGTEHAEDGIETTVATGEGRDNVEVDEVTTGYAATGAALTRWWPEARTVLIMGAKNAAALKLDEDGNVLDFDENDKCAAGVGRFLSDLTRFLDMELEELVETTLETEEGVDELSTQCSVFAESEVISLIHENVPPARISKGVHDAIAERNSSLIRRVGTEEDVVLVGGVGRNEAFVEALEETLGVEVGVPEHPAHTTAYGAAVLEVGDVESEVQTDVAPGEKRGGARIEEEI